MYTIGHTLMYDKGVGSLTELFKLGKSILDDGTEYPGGIVFFSKEEAAHYLLENDEKARYSIYQLDCDESNIYYNDEDETFHLIDSCKILKKVV